MKSRTTHINEGKNLANSSGSPSYSVALDSLAPALLLRLFLTWIDFERLTIRERFWRACSSIVPIELKTK